MQKLTDRQRAVLEYISTSISDRGYPPTLREIGNHLGIRSTNGVNDHLRALERKGYLTREDMKSRTLRLVRGMSDVGDVGDLGAVGAADLGSAEFDVERAASDALLGIGYDSAATPSAAAAARASLGSTQRGALLAEATGTRHLAAIGASPHSSSASSPSATPIRAARGAAARPANDLFDDGHDGHDDQTVAIPILGRVAAGALSEAIEHAEDSVRVDRMLLGRGGRDVFGLRIQGESMIDAGIHSGDFVFVRKQLEARRGDIVVALVGDEATCKYYFPERDHVRLEPANSTMSPIRIAASDWRNTQILGVVVGVYRRIES